MFDQNGQPLTSPSPSAGASPPPPPAPSSTPAPSAPNPGSGPGVSGAPPGSGATPAPAGGVSGPAGGSAPAPAANPAQPGLNPALAPTAQGPAAAAPVAFEAEFARRYGMDPSQAQMLMTMGWQQYTQREQQRQQPAQPAAAAQPQNPFGLPQFDARLLDFIAKGPNGELQLLPGAPPDAGFRYQQYADQLRQVQHQFWQDPVKFLGPVIEQRAQDIANRVYQQNFSGYQQQTTAAQLLQQNESWLYDRDDQGQRRTVFDPASGQAVPVLSAAGRAYKQAVTEAVQAGVQDPAMQHKWAVSQVQNQLLIQRLNQLGAAGQQQAGNAAFLQAGQPAAPAGLPPGVVQPPTTNTLQPAAQPGMTLRQVMAERLRSNGITDDVLSRQLAGAA